MTAIRIAWQLFWHQSKTGKNTLLLLTLFSLSFYLCLISLVGSSVQQHLAHNLNELLGADSLLVSDHALNEQQLQQVESFAAKLSATTMVSMTLTHKEKWQSAQIKGVDSNYPLAGRVRVAKAAVGEALRLSHGPRVGNIWLDSVLLSRLGITVGEQMIVAGKTLKVSGVLRFEPDRLIEGHTVKLRAMMAMNDFVEVSGQSEVKYRYLLKNDANQQQALSQWIEQNQPQWQLVSSALGSHPLAAIWLRIEKFIGLSAILLFVLGAITLDLTSNRLLKAQQHFFAVCMSAGMLRTGVIQASLWLFVLTLLATLVPAALLAVVVEKNAVAAMQQFFPAIVSNWQLGELLGVSALCLLLFVVNQLPAWLALWRVSITDLLSETSLSVSKRLLRTVFPLLGLLVLVGYYSDNWRLTVLVLLVIGFGILLLMFFSWLVIVPGERLARNKSGLLSFALYMMRQRLVVKSAQIMGIGLSLILVILCLRMTDDFTQMFDKITLDRDGDLLITKATEKQHKDLLSWATKTGSKAMGFSPFVLSRLVAVNNKPLLQHTSGPSGSLSELSNGVHLTWNQTLPSNNQLIKGKWKGQWDRAAKQGLQQLSVEDEVAVDIGLNVGDQLSFNVGGATHDFTVGAIHQFKAGASAMTFWFVLMGEKPATLGAPSNYMGSIKVSDGGWDSVGQLWQTHPTLQMMPLKIVKQKLKQFTNTGVAIVLLFNVFITLMSLLVLLASVQGFAEDDRKRNGLILSFGLSRRHCLYVIGFEWLITALIASFGALFGTLLAGELLYQEQFGMDYKPQWLWLILTTLSATGGIAALGIWLCRGSLKVSVTDLLNERVEVA